MALSAVIGAVSVVIGGDTGPLKKALSEADKSLKKSEINFENATKMAMKLAAGAAAAGGALLVMTQRAITNADQLHKLAQGAGMTTKTFSEMAYAARLSDVDTAALSTSMARLNRNISDAAAGTGEAMRAFKAMGIEVTNADGTLKNADQIMMEMADRFADMEDGAGKSALAVMVLGRAGAAMIPMLNGGSESIRQLRQEAIDLGVSIDSEAGKAAENFNDNITRLGQVAAGAANHLMMELLPALNHYTDAAVKAAKESDAIHQSMKNIADLLQGAALTAFQTIAVVGSDLVFVFERLGGEVGVIAAQLAAIASGRFREARIIGEEWTKDSEKARKDLDEFQARIMALGKLTPTSNPARAITDEMAALGIVDPGKRKAKAPGIEDETDTKERLKAYIAYTEEVERIEAEARQAVIDADVKKHNEQLQLLEKYKQARALLVGEIYDNEQAMAAASAAADLERANKRIGEIRAFEEEYMKTEEQKEIERYEAQLERLKQFTDQELEHIGGRNAVLEKMKQDHEDKMDRIEEAGFAARGRHRKLDLAAAKTFLGHMAGLMQGNSEKMFKVGKLFAIAETTVNTYTAAMAAYKALAGIPVIGPALGAAAAAAAIATGMQQISAIRSAQPGGGAAAPTFAASPTTGQPVGTPGGDVGRGGRQNTILHLHGEKFDRKAVRELVEALNEEMRDGGTIAIA